MLVEWLNASRKWESLFSVSVLHHFQYPVGKSAWSAQLPYWTYPEPEHPVTVGWSPLPKRITGSSKLPLRRQREDRCPVKPVPGKMSSSEVQDVGKDPSEELSHHIKTPSHPCYHTASQRESDASVSATSRREVTTPKACPDNLTFLCLCHLSFRCSPCIHIRRGHNYSKP